MFKRTGTSWTQETKLTALTGGAGDYFGGSLSISGDYIIIGTTGYDFGPTQDVGAAYVFKRNGTAWSQQTILIMNPAEAYYGLGASVCLSGDFAIVSALGDRYNIAGATHIFKRVGSTWSQTATLVIPSTPTQLPAGNKVFISGDYALVGNVTLTYYLDPNMNEASTAKYFVYAFKRTGIGSAWAFEGELVPNDITSNSFGGSLSISGDVAVVGAYAANGGQGAAYIYKHIGSTWKFESSIIASDAHGDGFGFAVSISGNNIIVGAPYDDEGFNTDQGAVYFFNK